MSDDPRKTCPMASTHQAYAYCTSGCAWWNEATNECALLTLAKKVSDIEKDVKRK